MESRPVKVVNINESLRSMLCELYESDFIFDKFEIALSPAGDRILTGGYGLVLKFFLFDFSTEIDFQSGIKTVNPNIQWICKHMASLEIFL